MKTTRLDKYINPKLLDPLVNLRPTLEAKGIEVLKGETGWNQAAVTMEDPREFLGVLERKGVDTVFAGPMYWDMSHHDLELTVENINKFLECYKQEPLSPEQTALLSVDIDEFNSKVAKIDKEIPQCEMLTAIVDGALVKHEHLPNLNYNALELEYGAGMVPGELAHNFALKSPEKFPNIMEAYKRTELFYILEAQEWSEDEDGNPLATTTIAREDSLQELLEQETHNKLFVTRTVDSYNGAGDIVKSILHLEAHPSVDDRVSYEESYPGVKKPKRDGFKSLEGEIDEDLAQEVAGLSEKVPSKDKSKHMDLQQLLDARTHSHLRLTETLDTYNDEGVVVASTVTLVEPDGPYEAYVHSDNGVILAGITVPSKFLTDEEFNEIEFDSIEDLKELGGFENHFDDLEDLENLEDLEDHIATVAASIIQPFIDPDTGEPYAWQHEQVDLMTGKPVEWQEDGEELDPFEHLEAVEGYSRTEVFAKDIIDEHIEELKAVLSDIQYDLVQERPQILRRLDAMTDKVKTKLRAIGIVHDAEMACENKPEENQRKTLGWEPLLLERANYDLLTPEGQSRLVKELKLLEDDLKAFMPFLTAPNPEPMLLEVLKQNNYKTLQGALATYGGLTDSSSPVIILSDLGQDIMREILYQGQMAVLEELYTERKFLRRSIESFGFSRDTHEETQIAAEVLKHLRDYIDNFGADSGEYLLARIMTMTLGDGRLALTRWGKDLVTDIYYNHNI